MDFPSCLTVSWHEPSDRERGSDEVRSFDTARGLNLRAIFLAFAVWGIVMGAVSLPLPSPLGPPPDWRRRQITRPWKEAVNNHHGRRARMVLYFPHCIMERNDSWIVVAWHSVRSTSAHSQVSYDSVQSKDGRRMVGKRLVIGDWRSRAHRLTWYILLMVPQGCICVVCHRGCHSLYRPFNHPSIIKSRNIKPPGILKHIAPSQPLWAVTHHVQTWWLWGYHGGIAEVWGGEMPKTWSFWPGCQNSSPAQASPSKGCKSHHLRPKKTVRVI